MIIDLPVEEAEDIMDRTYLVPGWELYETGFDAYHQLHCIVMLSPRRPVYPAQANQRHRTVYGSSSSPITTVH